MNKKSKITNLKITITPENHVIDFTGNVSIVEALSLLDNFKDISMKNQIRKSNTFYVFEIIMFIISEYVFLQFTEPTFFNLY
jgi:hypothetical protein